MTGFNLPPGCNVSDIPGNRPEDLAEEAFWETVDERFIERVGKERADYFFEIINSGRNDDPEKKMDFTYLVSEYAITAAYTEGQKAFDQGKMEMQLEDGEAEEQAIGQELITYQEAQKYHNALRKVKESWKD